MLNCDWSLRNESQYAFDFAAPMVFQGEGICSLTYLPVSHAIPYQREIGNPTLPRALHINVRYIRLLTDKGGSRSRVWLRECILREVLPQRTATQLVVDDYLAYSSLSLTYYHNGLLIVVVR